MGKPMESVFNELGGKRILVEMLEQEDLTRTFMALLHHIVGVCNKKGCGLDAVRFGQPNLNGNSITAPIHFNAGGRVHADGVVSGDIQKYFLQKNARCAYAMQKNPGIEKFWAGVLTTLRNYVTYKHGEMKMLRVAKAFITPGDVVKIEFTYG